MRVASSYAPPPDDAAPRPTPSTVILPIVLKRFEFSAEHGARKKACWVDVPELVDFTPYVSSSHPDATDSKVFQLKLRAAILHVGDNLQMGHYVAVGDRGDGSWTRFDDTAPTQHKIFESLEATGVNDHGYILLYELLRGASADYEVALSLQRNEGGVAAPLAAMPRGVATGAPVPTGVATGVDVPRGVAADAVSSDSDEWEVVASAPQLQQQLDADERHMATFAQVSANGVNVTGKEALEFFGQSKLPKATLAGFWAACVPPGQVSLNAEAFSQFMCHVEEALGAPFGSVQEFPLTKAAK
mmetsp:Transcript_24568/g.58009  ORF Transcript_24568/g.58009 Transcript_24568/m.58009 type:complete len:301 (+) Transcript_24568:711-1613(+)